MKKLFSVFIAAGLSLALFGAGCTNKVEGTWVSTQPIESTSVELEFTKSRIIGTANLIQVEDANKKSQVKMIVDYRVSKDEVNTLSVETSNPEANIVGTFADEKQQNQWQEEAKKYLKANNKYTITVATDKKTMVIKTEDGQEISFRKK